MRALLQRVKSAKVLVEEKEIASINRGLLALVGFSKEEKEENLQWMAKKILGLRIFEDSEGKMNLSLQEIQGEILVVSQFTLYADLKKGFRPSFHRASSREDAKKYYDTFLKILRESYFPSKIQEGQFAAYMEVFLINDGPVTLFLSRE